MLRGCRPDPRHLGFTHRALLLWCQPQSRSCAAQRSSLSRNENFGPNSAAEGTVVLKMTQGVKRRQRENCTPNNLLLQRAIGAVRCGLG